MADEYINKTELLFEMATSLIPQSMDITRGYAIAKDLIRKAPTADVAPVIHGCWYDEDSFDAHGSPIYRCSVCNKTVADNYISCHKFCLHCGADMRGVHKDV